MWSVSSLVSEVCVCLWSCGRVFYIFHLCVSPYQVFTVWFIPEYIFGSCYCSSFELECVAAERCRRWFVCVCAWLSYQVLSAHNIHTIMNIQAAEHGRKKRRSLSARREWINESFFFFFPLWDFYQSVLSVLTWNLFYMCDGLSPSLCRCVSVWVCESVASVTRAAG